MNKLGDAKQTGWGHKYFRSVGNLKKTQLRTVSVVRIHLRQLKEHVLGKYVVVQSYVESACIKSSSLSNHQDSACRLLSSPHTHRRPLEEERTTNKPTGKLSNSISSRSILKQTIHDLDFPENHPLILFLHRRPPRRQFERTTISKALIGLPTTSFSINCKLLSLIDRMRSSNHSIWLLMNVLLLAAPLLEQSQPRSA